MSKTCPVCGAQYDSLIPLNEYCCSYACLQKLCLRQSDKPKRRPTTARQRSILKLRKLRFTIMARDKFKCRYCGRNPVEDKVKLHVDHIIPLSKGGKTLPDNLATACEDCNTGKADTLLA